MVRTNAFRDVWLRGIVQSAYHGFMLRHHPHATTCRYLLSNSVRFLLIAAMLQLCAGCRRPAPTPTVANAFADVTLLLAKAQFEYEMHDGKRSPVPGPAKLVLVRRTDRGWSGEVVEDPESRVFHKAMLLDLPGEPAGLLTIGGTDAAMKIWRCAAGQWQAETIWRTVFGGRWNRFRDVEIGDVTGDGQADLVVATHDQGVVAVVQRTGDGWQATEIDRAFDTFVHEIELGDIDGDGVLEIFATPSRPNRASMESQPGEVVMYRRSSDGQFERIVVEAFGDTHAKEILFFPDERSGRPRLLVAVEAHTAIRDGSAQVLSPVQIKAYAPGETAEATWSGRVLATLPDRQCRFLCPGDVDADGEVEIVATGMGSGVWLLDRQPDSSWTATCIDRDSGGYEHAVTVVEGPDGRGAAIFVAADRQGRLNQYTWSGDGFEKEKVISLDKNEITFGITAARISR